MPDAILSWWRRNRRDLPWRRTRDPWAVLVSELMLQQTQVPRVLPRYQAFMTRFPTPEACAAAPAGEVVRAWAGLGYNRRAVNLHRAATVLVEVHGGRLPADLADLLALPGIGPYTARAILAFAFEADVGVLDVNAIRVLARAWGRRTQHEADAIVPPGQGWSWNQAILDIGATVCTKRAPRCERCPILDECQWHRRGRAEPDPAGPGSRQSTFAGSDRQGRGRLVDALRTGPVDVADLPTVMGWPDDPTRAGTVAATLVADGLAAVDGGEYRLP
jgi:A/G-specific adenine glycosylase